MLFNIPKIGHGGRVIFDALPILLEKVLARLLWYSDVPQSLGVVCWNDAYPSDIVEFDVRNHVLVFGRLAHPQDSAHPASYVAAEAAACTALL